MKKILILAISCSFLWSCSSSKKKTKKVAKPIVKKATKAKEPVAKKDKTKHQVHWGYTGAHGPSHWGAIKPEFATCKDGKAQSPVNLTWHKPEKGGTLKFGYIPTRYSIVDNGHAIQVDFPEGQKAMIHGHEYQLLQVHFHAVSEHTIGGKSYPAEAHFVHKNKEGGLAVVGVMIIEGEKNEFIDQLWGKIPSKKHQKLMDDKTPFNPMALLPSIKTHYHYKGSLTTPPCTEGVMWYVLNTPISMSQMQLAYFNTYYTKTNRPVQPLNNRKAINY
ncbi:MAG: carbonic anhydrase family protein [Bdellovibrionaceae bacterium]|jgi:carbonic anhydrase|nr:carbonic anhydrase family protein [Pseudobdellovibrionaceae bacterium]